MSSIHIRHRASGEKVWQVTWRVERKQTSATFATKPKALRFQSILESEGPAAAYSDASAVRATTSIPTLDAWVTDHIDHLTGITDGTRDKYRRVYASTFGPLLGHLELDLVTRRRVADAVNALDERLSAKSIANAHGLLSAALRAAELERIIGENPCHRLRLPRGQKREHRLLTHAEFGRLHDALPEFWRPFVITLAGTGMRFGEAIGLKVGNVDLDHGLIRITHAWKQGAGGTRVWDVPKSRKSKRTIALDPVVYEVVKALVAGRAHDDFVFTAPKGGTPWNATFYEDVWKPAVTAAGLEPPPRLSDLRHTSVAWLMSAGVSMPEIQLRLGHESYKTTSDIYGGLLPDVQARAAEASGAALMAALRPTITSG